MGEGEGEGEGGRVLLPWTAFNSSFHSVHGGGTVGHALYISLTHTQSVRHTRLQPMKHSMLKLCEMLLPQGGVGGMAHRLSLCFGIVVDRLRWCA